MKYLGRSKSAGRVPKQFVTVPPNRRERAFSVANLGDHVKIVKALTPAEMLKAKMKLPMRIPHFVLDSDSSEKDLA